MQLLPANVFENIVGRADRLFEDGYRVTVNQVVDGETIVATVTSPEGTAYTVNTLFEQCTCPCFKHRSTCKHLRGLDRLLEQTAFDRQSRLFEDAEDEVTGTDPHYWLDAR